MSQSTFTGFPPQALGFLQALAVHQSAPWFQTNREVFVEAIQKPFGALVDTLTAELARRKVPLKGPGHKAMFRMNRDTRFSKDKAPYKTNAGAVLSRDGSKKDLGLLYVNVDPRGSFLAAGVYQPEPPQLKAIRDRIVARPRQWRAVAAGLKRARLALDPEYALKRLPRGYEAVEAADLQAAVKLKSFVVLKDVSPALLEDGKKLVAAAVKLAEASLPLLRFCWTAVDGR